jgi:DNA-binding MarR family transcriptional regulator
MPESPALTSAELETWASFYTLRRRLDRALDLQLQRDSGLSASEYEVLGAINMSADKLLRIKAIAGTIGWEKSRVSHLVSRMEKRGLLMRTECDADARGSWIGLTTSGNRALAGAQGNRTELVRRYFFDALEDGDAARIEALAQRVVDAIGCDHDEDIAAEELDQTA